jgi:hypothetical protein
MVHLGLEGTCKELQEAKQMIVKLENEACRLTVEAADRQLRLERFEKENYRLGCLVSELRADADLYRATFGNKEAVIEEVLPEIPEGYSLLSKRDGRMIPASSQYCAAGDKEWTPLGFRTWPKDNLVYIIKDGDQ